MYGQTNGIRGVDIVESGSNSNGNWIKYADGTMICWHTLNKEITINNPWGVLYESSEYFSWTFPQTFTVTPSISVSRVNGHACSLENAGVATNEHSQNIYAVRPAPNANSTATALTFMAIGKWK